MTASPDDPQEPSFLEKQLSDAPETPDAPPLQEHSPSSPAPPADPLIDAETRATAAHIDKDIHFLYDEIADGLSKDMRDILFRIKHPLAGKHVRILNSFVMHVAYAAAQKRIATARARQPPPLGETTPLVPQPPRIEKRRIIPQQPPQPSQEFVPSALTAEQPPAPPLTEIKIIHVPLVLAEDTGRVAARADISEGKYTLIEPPVDQVIATLLRDLKPQITNPALLKNEKALAKLVIKTAKKAGIDYDDEDLSTIRYYLQRDVLHLGAVHALMEDKKITKIACEGQGMPLVVIRDDKKLTTTVTFPGKDELNAFILDVAKKTYQKVTLDDPVLDVTYKDFRIQGTLGTEIVPSRFIMTRIPV